MAARRRFAAGGLGRVLPLLFLLCALAGCSEEAGDFAVSPSLDPRASKIIPIRPGGFLAGRTCLVYLPPGYPGIGRRYPVLYVHDGEAAFDGGPAFVESFGFDQVANALIASGEIEPLIIVAIPSAGLRDRDFVPTFHYFLIESYPWVGIAADSTRGDRYVRALRDDLLPLVDRTFASDPSSGSTGIAGFSYGGLISVYAGYAYSETFGVSGGFSGSYFAEYPDFLRFVSQTGRPPEGSLFVDVGLIDDNVYAAEVLDATARRQGFVPGVDYEYAALAGETHSVASVRTRIPAFLKFFSRRVAASRPAAAVTPPGS